MLVALPHLPRVTWGAGQHLGQPPVHHLYFAVRPDHNVRRLQVAVDDIPTMGKCERLADLSEDLDDSIRR